MLLVGAALRLIDLDRIPPGLSHDEAYNGITALEVWLLGRREVFFEIYNGIEPLIVYWQALYLRLFGITPVAMRLVNVTAGMLTIALTYALTQRMLAHRGPRQARQVALLAALGISLSFWAVFVSRLALRAVTLPLLQLPAWYFLWLGLIEGQPQVGTGLPSANTMGISAQPSHLGLPRRLVYFAIGGACLGAAMYTYLSSRFLPFIPLLFFTYWLLRGQVGRDEWLGIAVYSASWALVFAPLGLYYLNHADIFARRADQVLNLPLALAGDPRPLLGDTLRTLGMFGIVGADTSRYGLAGRPLFEPVGAVLLCAGLAVSVTQLRRPARLAAPYAFLLIWWVMMLVPGFITGESPHFLRTIGAMVPAYIFWALGIVSLAKWLALRVPPRAHWIAPAALVVYLVAVGWLTVRDYFVRWASDAEARSIYGAEFTEVAHYLGTVSSSGPVALSAAFYRDWDRFRLDLQMRHTPPLIVWFDGRQTLLLPPPASGLQPLYIFTRSAPPHPYWLDVLRLEMQGADMSVYRLELGADPADVAPLEPIESNASVHATAEPPAGLIQLLGYRLEGEVQAGETLRLLLHWQPLRDVPGDPDYAFYIHLRDRKGYTWSQADANGYAVVDWQPGVQVLQWLELPLPPDLPPLRYTLVAGLEDRANGQPIGAPVLLQSVTPSIAVMPVLPTEFPVPNPSEVTSGQIFTLRGHSVDPRFLRAGNSTHVTLYWQAENKPGTDYELELWLIDERGERTELGSRQPLDGDYPTSLWQAGQWVRDHFDLTLPPDLPSGLYHLFVGWRDFSGVQSTTGGKGEIPLGEIFIADQ